MSDTKFASIVIMGEPNAGKSTLLNRLIGEKISIVTHKVQTTRQAIRGILTAGDTQLVFIDTPGIFKPKRTNQLERTIVRNATNTLPEADIICLLIDASRPFSAETSMVISMLAKKKDGRPLIVILNKVDILAKDKLLEPAQKLQAMGIFDTIAMISAKTGSGTEKLLRDLRAFAPQAPWQYEEDALTDAPMRTLCEEITRAELYINLHEELPYALTVVTESWKPDAKGTGVVIKQAILLRKDSQKAIVLGHGGEMIRLISRKAREKITRRLGQPVHLYLYAKVQSDWVENNHN